VGYDRGDRVVAAYQGRTRFTGGEIIQVGRSWEEEYATTRSNAANVGLRRDHVVDSEESGEAHRLSLWMARLDDRRESSA
jgi:hypothetical protein